MTPTPNIKANKQSKMEKNLNKDNEKGSRVWQWIFAHLQLWTPAGPPARPLGAVPQVTAGGRQGSTPEWCWYYQGFPGGGMKEEKLRLINARYSQFPCESQFDLDCGWQDICSAGSVVCVIRLTHALATEPMALYLMYWAPHVLKKRVEEGLSICPQNSQRCDRL